MKYSYLNPSTDERGRRLQVADLHYASKDYVESEKIYRAALEERPKDTDSWGRLAQVLREQGKHAPAAEAFVRNAENSSGHMTPYTWYAAAVEYAKAGNKEKAIGTLEKAFAAGYPDREGVSTEPALAAIASDPRVKQLVAKQ